MESKIKIAMVAILAVTVVSCSALAVTMMGSNGGDNQDTVYSVEVRVLEGEQYKSYPAQGKTVSEILTNAFGDKIVVASNGNVKSFNGKENDSSHSWMTFRWMSHDGWVAADKSNLVQGVSANNVSVVLCHDVKSYTVDSMESFIPWALSNGYTFIPLTENSPTAHHPISN